MVKRNKFFQLMKQLLVYHPPKLVPNIQQLFFLFLAVINLSTKILTIDLNIQNLADHIDLVAQKKK